MSEYVLGRVLEWFQRPGGWNEAQAARQWRGGEFREIHGTRWVVAGMGAIGEQVAIKARAFGAHVTGVRQNVRGDEPADAMVTLDQLAAVSADADVLVFALPSTSETDGLVDARFLAGLRPDSVIVNVGRGSLVVEDDLRAALDTDVLGVAILDVTLTEPLPEDHWMWGHPKVMLTAHKSGNGVGRHERSYNNFVTALRSRARHSSN